MKQRWWTLTDDAQISQELDRLLGSSEAWRLQARDDYVRLAWAYERDRLVNLYGWAAAVAMGGQDVRDRYDWASDLTTLAAPNIVKANVDALTTRTIADQPPLTVAAAGARWEDQFAVEEFESAMDAIFNTEANSRELSLGGRDALLAGI